jgi:osmotically-inducible protein OsmY
MKTGLTLIAVLLLLSVVSGCSDHRREEPTVAAAAETPPDNTGVNERDRDGGTLTPTDQAENEADRGVTQRVRQSIVEDDSLSLTARNVKIVTVNGVVTLRGPVENSQEKSTIESKAQLVAGVTRVDNQLEVINR